MDSSDNLDIQLLWEKRLKRQGIKIKRMLKIDKILMKI